MRYVLWCVAFLMAASMGNAQNEIENFVQNHDFEDGDVIWTMWVEDGALAGNVTKEVVEDDGSGLLVLEGELSLMINIDAKGKNNQRVELHQKPFILKKGKTYTYALFARAEPARQAKMICNHRAAPWTSHGSANIEILEEWQEFWAVVQPKEDDVNAGIYVELKDDLRGKIWFDFFRLYQGDYVEPDIPDLQPKAVQPYDKLTTLWGQVKQL